MENPLKTFSRCNNLDNFKWRKSFCIIQESKAQSKAFEKVSIRGLLIIIIAKVTHE